MPFADYEYGLAHKRAYQQSEKGKAAHARACKAYRERNKKRYSAHNTLNNALRDGRVFKHECMICGADSQAHHTDYDRPLDVVWLCDEHHKEAHRLTKRLIKESAHQQQRERT